MKKNKNIKNKNKKKNYLLFIIIFIVLFSFTCFNYYRAISKYFSNKKINDELKEKAINYMNDNYGITPDVFYIERHYEEKPSYEAVDMTYNDYEFSVKIYKNNITDDYMYKVLGNSMYDNVINSLKETYSTNEINVNKKNSIYLGYDDETVIKSNETVSDIFKQDKKETFINIELSLVNNKNISDQDLSNKLLEWINSYIKNKNIDNISLNINFINKSDVKQIKDINDSNSYAKRYIELYEKVNDIDIETTNGSIYVRDDNNFFYRPFVNE